MGKADRCPSSYGSPSVLCLGSRIANAHNSSVSNKFANDGSFLQQFLKLQKAQTSTGECCYLLSEFPSAEAHLAGSHLWRSLGITEIAGPASDSFLSPHIHWDEFCSSLE